MLSKIQFRLVTIKYKGFGELVRHLVLVLKIWLKYIYICPGENFEEFLKYFQDFWSLQSRTTPPQHYLAKILENE
jgi:hypothetical protein